jgi:tellurite resistance protein
MGYIAMDKNVTQTQVDASNFKVEVKYIEAAIEALASGKDKEEAERVRNFGNAILNVAIKTKQKVERKNG